ncbi:hypothetical protein J5N97_024440 [Dioscorea zingiberensis]|uniref:CCHC-type domain-containing protein n=1 Tax=Dioscorea zingiberensis TaxID=325984 RepID=A0A9D5C6Z6_9LILI|nr:hypothetical protein J5N97_024440 [Dioscorea zingiberensis]
MSRVWRRVMEPEQGEQRRTTTLPRRNEEPSRTAAEPQRVQVVERRRALSPLEDDLTYAEVTSGRRSSSPRIEPRNEEIHRPTSPEKNTEIQRKEAPWEEVRRKKQRSSPTTGDTARLERSRANYHPNRRSPPTKRTSSGVVEVCGRCRQPGHHAIDCRRLEVCRRCERPGHREATCPLPSSEMSTHQGHGEELHKKKGKKRKAKNEAGPEGITQAEETVPHQKAEPEKTSSHRGSIAIDEGTVEEIRRLRGYTIATVTKGYAGSVPSRRVKEEVAALVGPELPWSSEPFEDDRILLHCPSVELARKLESMGELKFKTFSVRCHPCLAAANSTGTAEGELRWLNIKGLPVFGRRLDMIARMLKPVGDLVYLAKGGGLYVGHCRAAVRVRRGKKLPTTLFYSVLTYEFTVRVELGRGEPPLPWDLAPEKMAAPGGAGADCSRERPRTEKNHGGPLGKNQEKTHEMKGHGQQAEDACGMAETTLVHEKSGDVDVVRYLRQRSINDGGDIQTKGQDALTLVNTSTGSRQLDKGKEKVFSEKTDKRGFVGTRTHVGSCAVSRNSPKKCHVAESRPPMENHLKSQPSNLKNPHIKSKMQSQPSSQMHMNPAIKQKEIQDQINIDLIQHGKGNVNLAKKIIGKDVTQVLCSDEINEKPQNDQTYIDPEKVENNEIDEDFDEELMRDIELEMEGFWKADLEEEEDTQVQVEERNPEEAPNLGKNNNDKVSGQESGKKKGCESMTPEEIGGDIEEVPAADPGPNEKGNSE